MGRDGWEKDRDVLQDMSGCSERGSQNTFLPLISYLVAAYIKNAHALANNNSHLACRSLNCFLKELTNSHLHVMH